MITKKTTYLVGERQETYLADSDQVAADRDIVQEEIRRLCPVAQCGFRLDLSETSLGDELDFSCPVLEFKDRVDAENAQSACMEMHSSAKEMVDGMAQVNAQRF